MNIATCLNCPHLQLAEFNKEFFKIRHSGSCFVNRKNESIRPNMIFSIYSERVEYGDIPDKCISKLEHMVLGDDTDEFADHGYQEIEKIFKEIKDKKVEYTTEGGHIFCKKSFNVESDSCEWNALGKVLRNG